MDRKGSLTKADGCNFASRMLFTHRRRLPTAASVRIVSMSRSDAPDSPAACRNSTLVCKNWLWLFDRIKSVFPVPTGGRRKRPLDINRLGDPTQFVDLNDFEALRQLAVSGVNR